MNTQTKLRYEEWLTELKAVFARVPGMSAEQAGQYVDGAEWGAYYNDDFSPSSAAAEDMSYWED